MSESSDSGQGTKPIPNIIIQNAFNNAPIGIFNFTPAGHIVSANTSLVGMFGYESPEELITAITDIATQVYAYPADGEKSIHLLAEHGEVSDHEYLFRRRDGTAFWGNINIHAIRTEDRHIVAYQAFIVDISEQKNTQENLQRLEWMLSGKSDSNIEVPAEIEDQEYGDLSELNRDRLVLKSIGRERLKKLADDYLELLGTSSAIYEANGDCAFKISASGWCRMMDSASRRLCDIADKAEAHDSGRWLCHESPWTECCKRVVAECAAVDIECTGGMRIYAVPILAQGNVVGVINFGYGEPPKDLETLQKLAATYQLDYDELVHEANAYDPRPPFIIELARKRLHATAEFIGFLIETKLNEHTAREALESNYALLQIAGETAKFGGWGVDLENNSCTWSDAVADIHDVPRGYAPPVQEAISFYAPEWREKITEVFSACADKGTSFDEEMEIITQKARRVWVRTIGRAVKDKNGKTRKVQGSFQDISDWKKAEEALRASEEMMRSSQSVAHICSYSTDLNVGEIEKSAWVCSPEFYNIFGIDETYPHTIAGWANFLHPDDRDAVFDYHESVVREKKSFSREYKIIRINDGAERWVHGTGELDFDAEGTPVRMHGAIQDITERKQAEEALRASEEMMRSSQSVAHICSYSTDLNISQIEKSSWVCSPEFYNIFGIDDAYPHTIAGWVNFIHPDDRDELLDYYESVVQEKKSFSYEYRIIRINDGAERWVHGTGELDFDADGTPVRMHGAIQDITERRRAAAEKEKLQSQLLQAQKLESIGQLAGGVAHDFNNMLSVILGRAEIALKKTDQGQPLFSNLMEIRKAAERSANLTRQLLAFARKQTVVLRIIDLNEAVEGMLQMLRRLIGEHIDLSWRPGKSPALVKVDLSQIDQILANLCVNARDAIDEVGKITIETDVISFDEAYCTENEGFVPGDYVLLVVSDNGCGISPESISHLFEPFFTTKDQGKGTGLGLASVYGAIRQNKGFIKVYSELGEGTTFKIYLPQQPVSTPRPVDTATAKPIPHTNVTILLVEDEQAILSVVKVMLEDLGYIVMTASSPSEALRLAREHDGLIDLLMTDVVMPEMNGRDLAEKLLAIYPGIKCLFMSGYTADVIAHHGVLDKDVNFIPKPFSSQDVGVKLHEVLEGTKVT